MLKALATSFCTLVVAMALGGEASAAITPTLWTSSDTNGTTVVSYSQGSTDDAPATLVFYAPASYIASFGEVVSDTVGTASITTQPIAGGAAQSSSGPLTVDAAASTVTSVGVNATLGSLATSCTGSASKLAFWRASFGGSIGELPVFVDQLAPTDPGGAVASWRITICLPQGLGKLVDLKLSLNNVFSVPSGWHLWHLLAVPYGANGKPAQTAAAEAEAEDRAPQTLTLKVHRQKAGKTILVGRLLQGGEGVGKQKVQILRGKSAVASVLTNPSGSFSVTVKSKAMQVVAAAIVPARTLGCIDPLFGPIPCVGNTIGPFTIASAPVKVSS